MLSVMKRLTIHLLIATLMLVGTLASPVVMAWSMPSPSQTSACLSNQGNSANQQQSNTIMTDCVVAVCGAVAAINASMVATLSPTHVTPDFDLQLHSGRILQGPDPFPPRHLHV